jgi:hypothetical protein
MRMQYFSCKSGILQLNFYQLGDEQIFQFFYY